MKKFLAGSFVLVVMGMFNLWRMRMTRWWALVKKLLRLHIDR